MQERLERRKSEGAEGSSDKPRGRQTGFSKVVFK